MSRRLHSAWPNERKATREAEFERNRKSGGKTYARRALADTLQPLARNRGRLLSLLKARSSVLVEILYSDQWDEPTDDRLSRAF
jgi:hypothetical protein